MNFDAVPMDALKFKWLRSGLTTEAYSLMPLHYLGPTRRTQKKYVMCCIVPYLQPHD